MQDNQAGKQAEEISTPDAADATVDSTTDSTVEMTVEVRENQPVDDLRGSEEAGPIEQDWTDELNRASVPYVGRWNQLVSTTNWEKGRIILQWRDELKAAGAPAAEYADEAWSLRVGSITGQHAGRLRRVYQRFADAYDSYPGLYWSHFHAAIDWDDAEMWLEGAVQNKWSISQMRRSRWDTLGQIGEQPRAEDVVESELDEDFEQNSQASNGESRGNDVLEGPRPEGPDFGDESLHSANSSGESSVSVEDEADRAERVQPFENLADLPEDLQEAVDSLKLAILHHKSTQWEEVSRDELLACLEALKQLAIAPSD